MQCWLKPIFLLLLILSFLFFSAFAIFCLFTVFFWAAFEQAAGSLPLYTRDFTDRFLEGNSASLFKLIDLLVTVIPLGIITFVLIKLFQNTYKTHLHLLFLLKVILEIIELDMMMNKHLKLYMIEHGWIT